VAQEFKIINVEKSSIPDDNYGNQWYQIDVDGHNGPLLFLTSKAPEKGQTLYGHTELTKSGKAMRFKRDEKPEGYETPQVSKPTHISESMPQMNQSDVANKITRQDDRVDSRQSEIRYQVCFKIAGDYVVKWRENLDPEQVAQEVVLYADELYRVNQVPADTSTAKEVMGM